MDNCRINPDLDFIVVMTRYASTIREMNAMMTSVLDQDHIGVEVLAAIAHGYCKPPVTINDNSGPWVAAVVQ